MKRRQSIPVQAGKVTIGGSAPISIQTMSTVSPAHTAEAIADAKRLASYGAEILRFAVPDMEAAKGLSAVVSAVDIPIVADIHFDYRLALAAVDSGVQALRINPGNIAPMTTSSASLKKSAPRAFPSALASIRGSLPADILRPTAVTRRRRHGRRALRHIRILERLDYRNMVISLKASDVPLMIESYQELADKVPYALHLGVTEAGLVRDAALSRPSVSEPYYTKHRRYDPRIPYG